jgi:hypothetical protein
MWRSVDVSSVYIRTCDSKRFSLLRQLDRNELADKSKEEVRAVTL